MITKAYITEIDITSNKFIVEIPLFSKPGISQDTKLSSTSMSATLSKEPTARHSYEVGDVVYVGFEDVDLNRPVILGKLYLKDDDSKTVGGLNVKDIIVKDKATLPANTTIGDIDFSSMSNYINLINDYLEQLSFKDLDILDRVELQENKGKKDGYAPLDSDKLVPKEYLPTLKDNDIPSTVERVENKGVKNGYASLDASIKVPIEQIPDLSYLSLDGGTLTGSLTMGESGVALSKNNRNLLGTQTTTLDIKDGKVWFGSGAIFYDSAVNSGLMTRGVCGINTSGTSKENLYVNYDGNNDYLPARQLILQAGETGTHYGYNLYQYAAARGDAVKAYTESNFATINHVHDDLASIEYVDDNFATIEHNHGNIATDGKLINSNISTTSGDKIIIADMSNNFKITNGPTFGKSTTAYLRNDGVWGTPYAPWRDSGFVYFSKGSTTSWSSFLEATIDESDFDWVERGVVYTFKLRVAEPRDSTSKLTIGESRKIELLSGDTVTLNIYRLDSIMYEVFVISHLDYQTKSFTDDWINLSSTLFINTSLISDTKLDWIFYEN